MNEELANDDDLIDLVGRVREENYMRGYKDGFQQGRLIGFEDGMKKGIREMERVVVR